MVKGSNEEIPFPPYLASSEWYSVWLRFRLNGEASPEITTNTSLCLNGRDFGRSKIGEPKAPMLLTLPICGGGRTLDRRGGLERAMISDHGDWPRLHSGAIEAIYGRTPFYPYLAPRIHEIIMNHPDGLSEMCYALHDVLSSFILTGIGNISDFSGFSLTCPAAERGIEVSGRIQRNFSVIDLLMRFGPESVLGLLKL